MPIRVRVRVRVKVRVKCEKRMDRRRDRKGHVNPHGVYRGHINAAIERVSGVLQSRELNRENLTLTPKPGYY